jgi:hypothetical protein
MYHGMFCAMAAFKQHCTFGFWHPLMRSSIESRGSYEAMGQFGPPHVGCRPAQGN